MSRRANGARWFASNSLKFRVGGVFVNGKMTVSLPLAPCQDSLGSTDGAQGAPKEVTSAGFDTPVVPAQQRVLAVGETRDRAEASEKPPYPWNPALRRSFI